jgi:hypothetical protein
MKILKIILIVSFIGLLATGILTIAVIDPFLHDKIYYLALKDVLKLIIMSFTATLCLSFGLMVILMIRDFFRNNR